MTQFTVSEATKDAQLQATATLADAGAGVSSIQFFNDQDTHLATVLLAKPCATLTGHLLQLHQGLAGGDMIVLTGVATHAVWVAGDGTTVASGAVSDAAGVGPFILGGADGTQLYAGGKIILGVTEIG